MHDIFEWGQLFEIVTKRGLADDISIFHFTALTKNSDR